MRAEILRHLEADNADLPREYCDRHGGYVDEGRTQPMATGSPYRVCDGCIDEAHRRQARASSYCDSCGYLLSFHVNGRCPAELGPKGARATAGDR